MVTYIIRRLLQALLVLLIVTILIFLVMRLLPGDPILIYISQNQLGQITAEDLNILRHEFGLDRSLPEQYFNWMSGIFHGDFGVSTVSHDKVSKLLAQSLPITIHLGTLALFLSCIVGVLTGTLAAIRRGKWLDTVTTFLANIGITVPVFWLGVLMIYLFGLELKWLPVFGYTSPFQNFWLGTKQLIMPVICLSLLPIASIARQTRSSILEVIQQDYIRTAWSKGLKERDIVLWHTLKNGLIPVVTLIGIQVTHIFGGSVFIETIFNIPGMGRLMVTAVFAKDLAIVQSGCLIIAIIVVLTNLIVDISYGWLDPRIRYG